MTLPGSRRDHNPTSLISGRERAMIFLIDGGLIGPRIDKHRGVQRRCVPADASFFITGSYRPGRRHRRARPLMP